MAETVYSKFYTDNKLLEAERKQKIEYNNQLREQERQRIEEENTSVWERIGVTIADVVTELGGGLLKLVEGVVDAGTALIGGTFWAEDFIKTDWTQKLYYDAFEDEFTKNSYINDVSIVKDIIRGVGQQLPTIAAFALAVPTGGASLAVVPYTIGATVASAGGSGAEEALNDGANGLEALAYGALQAGIEGAVEYATAGMGKGITNIGKSVGKSAGKSVVKSVGKAMLEEGLSEATEEGLSALLNPLTKTVYQGKEALEAYKDMSFYMDAAQQAFVGGVVGGISGGVSGKLTKSYTMNNFKKNTNISTYTNENHNILQSQSELDALDVKEDNLRKNGKMNEKKLTEMKNAKNAEYGNISENLKKMDAETRSKVIEKLDLDGLFDADGNINQDAINATKNNNLKPSELKNAQKTLQNAQDFYNKNYEMTNNGEKSDIKIEFDNDILDSVEDKNFANVKSAIRAIGNKSGTKIGVALIKTDAKNIQAFKDNGNIYITRQNLKDGSWAKPVAHEAFHFIQNNETGKQLTNFLKGNEAEFAKAKDRVLNENYGVNQKDIDNAFEKIKNNEKLTDKEQLALDEIGASMVENVLGNEQAIKRICMENTSLASKILNKIKDLIKLFTGTTAERTQLKLLNTAEKLFTKSMVETKKLIYQWEKKTNKNFEQYLKDKEKYLSLKESQKEEWLKNHGYKAEDFNDDILESYDDKVQFDSEQGSEYNGNEVANLNYNLNSDNNYTKSQYESFGWVRANDVITKNQWNDFNSKFAKLNKGENTFVKTANNEYIIPVNNMVGDSFGIDNVLIFAKGSYQNPNITKIIKINLTDETSIDYVRRYIYERERNTNNTKGNFAQNYFGEELISELRRENFQDYQEYKGKQGSQRSGDNGSTNIGNNKEIKQRSRDYRNIRYSLKETVEQDVIKEYGKTYNWNETGYILTDGSRLDMSGRKDGAPGGYRTVDHRDIFGEDAGIESMIEFMSRGNIRVIPEYPGINLQVEPNTEQYNQIEKLIETLGWKNKEFMVDFDNANGDTIDSLSYDGGNVRARQIISDIKYYFKEGKLPYKSELSQFRYSLDSNGNKLTLDQANYFKNSKVRDKDGNLLVIYHGTGAEFTIFDKNMAGKNFKGWSQLGKGFYFAYEYNDAMRWAERSKGDTSKVLSTYVNIIQPFNTENFNVSDFTDVINKYNIEQEVGKIKSSDGFKLIDVLLDKNINTTEILKSKGYDGIITPYQLVAFDSNQIKNIDNKKPTTSDDIRYSLKDGNGDYNYSKGQIAKYVAEHSKLKAYSKTDAEQIINTVVSNQLAFGNKYGDLSNKTKAQVIDTLWHSLNTNKEGYRGVLDIADYIIDNAVMEDVFGDEDNTENARIIGSLKKYLHNIDLNGIKGEIAYHYDKDNSPYAIWGKRRDSRYASSPDQIGQELAEEGIFVHSSNEADIFFEIDDMYRNALKNMKKKSKEKLAQIASKEELAELRQSIARELLLSFDETGHKTMFANTIEKYTSKISQLKQAIRDIKAYNKAKNNAISTIERLRDEFIKNKPAGWKIPEQVVNFVKKIAKVETWRNNISTTAREHLLELNNQIDLVMDETQQQIYPFREIIRELGSGKGELTTQELQTLDIILRQFAWQLKNYNKVNFENSMQDVDSIASQGVQESKQAKSILRNGSNILIKFKNKVYTNPYDRLAEIGLYRENSISMRLYKDMLQGDRNRAKLLYDVNQSFNNFFNEHKGYLKELQKTIIIGDITLTKRQALTLYCISLREQGRAHLFNQGYNNGVVHILDNKYSTQGKTVEAFAKGKDVNITADTIAQIKESLTEADKAYLEVVDNFFNKTSKQAKKEIDQKFYGISNVEDGYYFPIKVSNDKIYTEAGQNNQNVNQYILDLGMNKSTKPHANNKIVIDGIDNIISNHLQSLSLYYGYAVPLTAYNRIMNKQVVEFDGADSTSNMRGEIQKIDADFENYMNKLWQDVQGIRKGDKGFVSSLLSKIRWAGANSALGANPKVLVTQTLSLAAGISEFNPKYIAKGMGHFFGEKQKLELSKYSPLMWERMQIGNSVDITEIRQIGKEIGTAGKITAKATKFLNDFTTKPISWMDSNVIQSLWFAAQYEVADTKGKGFEFGTEANKTEAGKRLDEVVFRTQQTSDPLGRSEWMRSQNEFVKFVRMFTGDSVQLTGRLISSVNKYNIAKKMIKSNDTQLVEQGQKLLKTAKKDVTKASGAFILNQTMLVAIAMMFKWLKGKDDDEEWDEIAKNEAIANIMGLIPFGGDIYDKLLGYEPTNMAYTALSNTVEMAQELYDGISTLISGDYQSSVKRNAAIRKTVLNISRLLGIPTQNLESYIKGIVGHVEPGTREEYEALFKTKSNTQYLNKIKKATEDGNEDLAETVINIMFKSRTGKIKDDNVLDTTRNLVEAGYDVIPKSVGTSITYDGVQYTLTNKQHTQFTKIYSQANEQIKALVNNSTFNRIEDVAKAKAMNFVYDYYYNLAIEDMLGEDLETKNILFAEAIPIEQLAIAVAQARTYESDIVDGKVVAGSKKTKISTFVQSLKLTATQKYMIMGYLGYTNKYGDTLVKAYINRLNITKSQKEQLYQMSGYAA